METKTGKIAHNWEFLLGYCYSLTIHPIHTLQFNLKRKQKKQFIFALFPHFFWLFSLDLIPYSITPSPPDTDCNALGK